MTWTDSTASVGQMFHDTDILKRMADLIYARGEEPAQAGVYHEAPLQVPERIESSHATVFDLKKQMHTNTGTAAIDLRSVQGTVGDLAFSGLRPTLGVLAGTQHQLGDVLGERESERSGRLSIEPRYLDVPILTLCVASWGYLGMRTQEPLYPVDVPAGAINVTGDYLKLGAILADWAFTGGTPDRVDFTGSAKTALFRSAVADGTTPATVASATLSPDVDAELVDGLSWCSPVTVSSAGTLTTSDTIVAETAEVGRVGKWVAIATGSAFQYDPADPGRMVTFKLKNAAGTQVGESAELEFDPAANPLSVLFFGPFTAAATTEKIKLTGVISAGSGGNYVDGTVILKWVGP